MVMEKISKILKKSFDCGNRDEIAKSSWKCETPTISELFEPPKEREDTQKKKELAKFEPSFCAVSCLVYSFFLSSSSSAFLGLDLFIEEEFFPKLPNTTQHNRKNRCNALQ